MAQYNAPQVKRSTTHEELLELFAMLCKDIQFIINGHLDANNIKANSIETKNLKADAVTADKIDVNELSAISANLGHITAGLIEAVTIIGSLIKTANSGQRVEISSTDKLIQAIDNAGNYIKVYSSLSGGSPTIEFYSLLAQTLVRIIGNTFVINGVGAANIQVSATAGDLQLFCGTGKNVKVTSWDALQDNSTGETMQTALSNKADTSLISAIFAALSSLDSRVSALEGV